MNSTRIAPIYNKLDERYDNKKISFHPPTSNDNDATLSYHAYSLPASFLPAGKYDNDDDCIKMQRIIAKTASCPTQVFPTTSEITSNKNHIIDGKIGKANSRRRLLSGRIRSLSIPSESTDTMRLDFFGGGDTNQKILSSPPSPLPLVS